MDYPIVEIKNTSKHFPKLLKHIHQPPKQLYCRGNVGLLNSNCFAVVGTRKITPYGKEVVQKIVPGLVKDFTIVSGMALGVDAVAHRAALDARGKTIAVLGSGIANKALYPKENVKLAKDILLSGGLIVSEYEPETKARPEFFPHRNRIISGLSKGTLIAEADIKSGTLITARLTMEQNRDVFAVPGNIFSSRTAGPHMLIKHGAKLVTSAEDILEEYDQLPLEKKCRLSTANPTEALILDILATSPCSADMLIEQTGKETSEILATLSMMELAGLINQNDNGLYRVNE
jgi:DNA processing protein